MRSPRFIRDLRALRRRASTGVRYGRLCVPAPGREYRRATRTLARPAPGRGLWHFAEAPLLLACGRLRRSQNRMRLARIGEQIERRRRSMTAADEEG